MYVSARVTECDFTDRRYPNGVQGADILAQGATGRWCCVMTCGPEQLRKSKVTPISREKAVEECLKVLREQNEQRPEVGRYTEDELQQFIDF